MHITPAGYTSTPTPTHDAAFRLAHHLFGVAPVAPEKPGAGVICMTRNMDEPGPAARRERPGLHRHPATELLPAMRSLTCASVRNAGVPEAGTQMSRDIALQWADALESSRFRRGARRLKDAADKHSALGVLCELHRDAHGGAPLAIHGASYLGESMLLPRGVLAWAGMALDDAQGPAIAVKSRHTRQWRTFAVNVHEFMGATWADIARALRSQI